MAARAELITLDNVEEVATGIVSAVSSEQEWLETYRPGFCARYDSETAAVQSLLNVVKARTMDVFAMRDDGGEVMGLGTRIDRLRLYDPVNTRIWPKIITADEIDYWARANVTEGEHSRAALSLIAHTATRRVLGLLPEWQKSRAVGIVNVMDELGEPHNVRIAGRRDYGLQLPGTPPVQAYIFTKDGSVESR